MNSASRYLFQKYRREIFDMIANACPADSYYGSPHQKENASGSNFLARVRFEHATSHIMVLKIRKIILTVRVRLDPALPVPIWLAPGKFELGRLVLKLLISVFLLTFLGCFLLALSLPLLLCLFGRGATLRVNLSVEHLKYLHATHQIISEAQKFHTSFTTLMF